MKNTASASPAPKSVSEKTVKENIQPLRVSDMGMRMRMYHENKKKQVIDPASV